MADTEAVAREVLREVIRDELERVRDNSRAELAEAAGAVAELYAASLFVYLGAVFLTLMSVYILGTMIAPWMGAAIAGSTLLVASLGVLRHAWKRFQRARAFTPR